MIHTVHSFKSLAMGTYYYHSLDEYLYCFRNFIYAGNVHRGILHFHLSLFRGPFARGILETEAKNTALCFCFTNGTVCWRVSVMASTWFKAEFSVVNGNINASWYAVHTIRLNSYCFIQHFANIYLT